MNKKLYFVSLFCFGLLVAFSKTFDAWASDSATHSDTAPLLEGNAKKSTHQLSSARSLNPDASGTSSIMKYRKYYYSTTDAQSREMDIVEILWDLNNNADKLSMFKMSAHDFHIPDYLVTGLWNDFHNPELASYIKAILEKKTETTGSRTKAEMDISALSSGTFPQSTNHSSASGLGQVDAADVQSDDDNEASSSSCAQQQAYKRKPYIIY